MTPFWFKQFVDGEWRCCFPVWPELSKIRHFGNFFESLWHFLTVYLLFGKMLNLLWRFFNASGQNFVAVNEEILRNNLATFRSLCCFDIIVLSSPIWSSYFWYSNHVANSVIDFKNIFGGYPNFPKIIKRKMLVLRLGPTHKMQSNYIFQQNILC